MQTLKEKAKKKHQHRQRAESTPAFLTALLKNVNAQCEAELRTFCEYDSETGVATLSRMWQEGRMVENLKKPEYSIPREGDAPVNVIAVLAQAVNRSESLLNKWGQLYRAYPTEEKKKKLLSLKLANGRPVTWGHHEKIFYLYSKDGDNSEYERVLKMAQDKSWGPDDLGQYLKTRRAVTGGVEAHAGGRPVGVPPTFHGRVTKGIKSTELMNKITEGVLVHPEYGLLVSLRSMGQEDIASQAEDLSSQLASLLANQRLLGDSLSRLGIEIDAAITYIRQCSVAHVESNGKSEADRLDAADSASEEA